MSQMKLALDVAQNLRDLADSIEVLVNAVLDDAPYDNAGMASRTNDETLLSSPSNTPAAQAEPKLTIVELRAFVAERSTPENRPKIKEILNRFGVNKLTQLAEDQYAAVMRAVEAL